MGHNTPDSLWPPAFHDNGVLADDRVAVEQALDERQPFAIQLWQSLLEVVVLQNDPTAAPPARAAEVFGLLSERVYRFLRHRHALGPAMPLSSLPDWREACQEILRETHPTLQLVGIMPRDSFNFENMVALRSNSGGRLAVAEAHSWIVLEKTGGIPKVLRYGKVVTA